MAMAGSPPVLNIPLVDLKANYASVKAEIDRGIAEVLASCHFVGGPQIERFERHFAEYIGVAECVALNTGYDALYLAFKLLGVGPGDEIITQANTYVATCLGMSNVGASIVLVDAERDSFLMDVSQLEAAITPRTKAIVPVHLYGQCCDMDAIMEIAARHGVTVVEDVAQAAGALYKGRKAGTFGHVSCFSFYPGKNLGAFGDSGALCTNDSSFATRLRQWRNNGGIKKYEHVIVGGSSRMDTIQAAVLDAKLPHLDAWNARRRDIADAYIAGLAGVGDVVVPAVRPYGTHTWHLFVVQSARRDELLAHLQARGIGAAIHYPRPIHLLPCYSEMAHLAPSLPVATELAPRILTLPVYPEMTDEQVAAVVGCVKDFFAAK